MADAVDRSAGARITTVTRQHEDDHVLVSLPMVGFPPGFWLRPGDQVVLEHEETGPVVRPLVRAVTVQKPPQEGREELVAEGETFSLRGPIVREDEDQGPPYTVWVVPNAEGQPGQAIAFGSQRW